MSWTFNDIKYGWKIAAGITLAGTTIFVADNQRQRINQADVIEIVLGTYERCLATERTFFYSDRHRTYSQYIVTPPVFTQIWQDAEGNTNEYTNTIGWRIDQEMLDDIDSVIKALVPVYIDEDNTNNNLTVTGLWAKLNIGDGVDQFTSYGYRTKTNAFVERYKVLEALKDIRDETVEGISVVSKVVPDFYGVVTEYEQKKYDTPPDDTWYNYPLLHNTNVISWADYTAYKTGLWETNGIITSGTVTNSQTISAAVLGQNQITLWAYVFDRVVFLPWVVGCDVIARRSQHTPSIDFNNFFTNSIYGTNAAVCWSWSIDVRSTPGPDPAAGGGRLYYQADWNDQGSYAPDSNTWASIVFVTNQITTKVMSNDYPLVFPTTDAGSLNMPRWSTNEWWHSGNTPEVRYSFSIRPVGGLTNRFDFITTNGFYYCTNKYW